MDRAGRFWLIAGPHGGGKTTYAFKNVLAVSGSPNFVNPGELVTEVDGVRFLLRSRVRSPGKFLRALDEKMASQSSRLGSRWLFGCELEPAGGMAASGRPSGNPARTRRVVATSKSRAPWIQAGRDNHHSAGVAVPEPRRRPVWFRGLDRARATRTSRRSRRRRGRTPRGGGFCACSTRPRRS